MRKKRIILLIIFIIEILLTFQYVKDFNVYYGPTINILYLIQIPIFIAFSLLLLSRELFSKKVLLVVIIISAIVVGNRFLNDEILLKFISDDLKYNGETYDWEYNNLYDSGDVIDTSNIIKYEVEDNEYIYTSDTSTEYTFIDGEMLKDIDNNVISNWKLSLQNSMLSFNNDKKFINTSLIKHSDEDLSIDLDTENIVSTFNDGEYLHSINEIDGKAIHYTYNQDGTIVSSTVIEIDSSKVDTETGLPYLWYIGNYDTTSEELYVTIISKSYTITVIKINSDGACEQVLETKIDTQNPYTTLMEFVKIDNGFRIVANPNEVSLYIIEFDMDGNITKEIEHYIEPSLYASMFLNVYYEDGNVFVISHVLASGNTDKNYYSEDYNIIRIDQLNEDYELQNTSYFEESKMNNNGYSKDDSLGDFATYYRVEVDGDKYTMYSNDSKIEYVVQPKEKIKILNRYVTYFNISFMVIILFMAIMKILFIMSREAERKGKE